MALNRTSKLTTWFPQAQHPIIISAPMLGTSNATLAAEVSKAGGIGKNTHPFSPSTPRPPFLSVSQHR
jgi:nitronate monooxygenase